MVQDGRGTDKVAPETLLDVDIGLKPSLYEVQSPVGFPPPCRKGKRLTAAFGKHFRGRSAYERRRI